MTALMNMVVFQMSLVCPICRKDIARKIKRDLPRMVIYASQIAASNEDPPLPSAIASTNQDHR
jgi:hypothetical protein